MPSLRPHCHHLPVPVAWAERPVPDGRPCPWLPHQASTLGPHGLSPNIPMKLSARLCTVWVEGTPDTQGTPPYRPQPHLLSGTYTSFWCLFPRYTGCPPGGGGEFPLHPTPAPPPTWRATAPTSDTRSSLLCPTTSPALTSKLSSLPLDHGFSWGGTGRGEGKGCLTSSCPPPSLLPRDDTLLFGARNVFRAQ